jgi:GTP cyclohydrolase I
MDSLETIIACMLKQLGVNLKDANFKETPSRVAKMYKHFFRNEQKEVIADIKKKVFPSKNDQIVIVKNIECFGMCPHHLLPVIYKVAIGYMPHGH